MSASTTEDRVLWSTELRDGEELWVNDEEFGAQITSASVATGRTAQVSGAQRRRRVTIAAELAPEVIAALEQAGDAA